MNDFIYEIELKVRDYECDLQGIVNNSVYQCYLEHARHEYIAQKGISFKKLFEQNIILMVARIEIEFKRSLTSGDKFRVKLRTQRDGARLVFHQNIYRSSDDALCITAKVESIAKINGKMTRGEIFDKFEV